MKELMEGFLMCVGVGFLYLGASEADQGRVVAGLIMCGIGFCFMCLMLAIVIERK